MKEMVGGCCVCSDERGWPDNPLVYCDGNGCTVAVHQACYGIVTVPTGPWFCRKCECPETVKSKVRCELCPSRSGALKKADTGGWAHVVCALYIPEVRFGNVTSMEPIVLRLIPPERFTRTCYICTENGKAHRAGHGACMACNKSGCKQQFHVTCAQSLGLLCEEAGNYLDNVKYCGYCQHHYSKLKKGGNVKTIPPYKPVANDSHSSESSSEKEGGASPVASGSGTPTPHTKGSKGPGRKSSQNRDASKNSHASKAAPASTPQPMDKKKSPSRRQSATGDGSSTSKSNTPAPSPSHTTDLGHSIKVSGSTSERGRENSVSRSTPPSASPTASKSPQTVISSVASVTAASAAPVPSTSASVTTSVVQTPAKPSVTFQESVITNTDAMETKHTKKRKAAAAAASAAAEQAAQASASLNEPQPGTSGTQWDHGHSMNDASVPVDTSEKNVKKAKTDTNMSPPAHYLSPPPPPPLPPMRSPRRLTSPMPGPSNMNPPAPMNPPSSMNPPSAIRSPSHHQGSLEMPAPPPPHVFHQPQKPATMESSIPSHSSHAHSQRTNWGGLNVTYEMQQDPNKPGVSGIAGSSKDHNSGLQMPSMPMPAMPPSLRNKKRAAMAAASMANTPLPPPPSPIQMASTSTQSLATVRRHSQLPPQQSIYQETVKESPPVSPNTERQMKAKAEQQYYSRMLAAAPHMLGNELNPESGAAARLQEQLNAELAAHAVAGAGPDPIVPPPLMNKAAPGARAAGAQSLDQLLERQWEQGSQFLMEQAQHFDIASLLSCLHQLRTENVRLEEHVSNLLQRRDHLLAVNARLAIPLNSGGVADSTYQLAFQGTGPPLESARAGRELGPPARPPPAAARGAEGGGAAAAERERHAAAAAAAERHAERAQVAQQLSHQLLMREVQQKPS